MKTAFFTICFFIISCSNPQKQKVDRVVVSNLYKPKRLENGQIDSTAMPPLPLPFFYLKHHFLIDSIEQVYYYQLDGNDLIWTCETGYDHKVPSFIGLKPKDIVQIPVKSIEDFARQNILNDSGFKRNIIISTLKDTLTAGPYFRLYNILKDSVNVLNTRLATQEEVVVLNYKQNHKDYLPNMVHFGILPKSNPCPRKAMRNVSVQNSSPDKT